MIIPNKPFLASRQLKNNIFFNSSRCFIITSVIVFFLFFLYSPLYAQSEEDDIVNFLREGENCYKKGLLNEAALEFENVLIVDKSNFDAKVWLAQIYIDKKDIVNARKLLREASIKNPNNPRVKKLFKLIGEKNELVKQDLVDPVIAETIGGIASATKSRKYGLVIPENKINEENLEKRLLITSDEIFKELEKEWEEKENTKTESNSSLKKLPSDQNNPLQPVFDIYNNKGLNQALDKYFELLIRDPSLASNDDKGIIYEGNRVYSLRFGENPNDLETRYYYGILQYINGYYSESEDILKPLRSNPGKYGSILRPYFSALNKWQEEEKIRLAAKLAEEKQRIANEALEKAKAEANKNDVWAKIKERGEVNQNKNGDLADKGEKSAVDIHEDGYKLYKKGRLDEAIEKLSEAVNKDSDNVVYNYHLGLAWMDKGHSGNIEAYDNALSFYKKVVALSPNSKLGKDAEAMIKDLETAKASLGE